MKLTSFGVFSFSTSLPSSSVTVILSLYPVIDFTFIITVPSFVSTNLFTVIVIVVPSSTVVPDDILCFKTTPFPLVASSSYSTFTTNPADSNVCFAVASSLYSTDVTTTCLIPVPMLIFTLTVSPAFIVSPSSMSCSIVIPASTVLLVASSNSTLIFDSSAISSASSFVNPVSLGTVVVSVPKLTTTFISVFCFIFLFSTYGGFCEIILPASYSVLYSCFSSTYFILFSSNICLA